MIIVSGFSETGGVIRCIEAGAEDYLNKPFNPTLLQARLNAGLQRKRWHDREEAYRRELERNERFIRNTFGRYLSDEIVDALLETCLLYTSDAADERSSVDLGGRRIIKKNNRRDDVRGRPIAQ